MFSLEGRIALVTGASRGLGWEIAAAFARAGALVLVNGRDPDHAGQRAQELTDQGLLASPLPFDVGDTEAMEGAMAEIERRLGRLDILVNNVGARLRIPLADTTPEAFHAHLNVNLTAAFALTRRAATLMIPAGRGRIVMITSIAADMAPVNNVAYIAAKGGLASLTRSFAVEYGPLGITCNAIAPGIFATETNAATLVGSRKEMLEGRVPLRRLGMAGELAGPAVFLASDAASYVNGHVLTVDGGFTVAF